MPTHDDSFSVFDPLLAAADITVSPWNTEDGCYEPDFGLLEAMLAIPISAGEASKPEGGRTIKALDAWIAHELRRAGFDPHEVWPRPRRPRVLPASLSKVEQQIAALMTALETAEEQLGRRLRPNTLRNAVRRLRLSLPGPTAAHILGRFYVKQVDVVISSWQHGPEVLVSTKSQFSSYNNNRNNRYEETIGEATNLRDRYPMAAMGYAFLVRSNIYAETGAFVLLRDLLVRLRKPDGPYAATMLLVADWDDELTLRSVRDAETKQLTASRFFTDLIGTALTNTPVQIHPEVRQRRGDDLGGQLPREETTESPTEDVPLEDSPSGANRIEVD